MTDPKPSSASSRPGVWEPPSPEALQALLPQYEILTMLGRGGMGAVYKGVQKTLDRPVAIKILSAALDESEQGFSERFKNEAKAMAKLNHPGIVGVFDFGQTADGLLYIVMEFVEGTDVAKMLAKQRRLPVDHAMAITAHVCDALAYAHERGIIHRDIKPANIMVGYDGIVRVADFGLAKMTHSGESGLTQSGMAMGTLHYMAPEALMLGSSVDHRADIYAVGVMLYQMLAGKLPQGLFQMPSKFVADLDPRYDGIIGKAMREDREVRYQTILALRADLDHILTQPVIKVEAAAEKAPAALPTQARPQRTIPQRQSVPEPEFAPPPRRSSSNTLVWATVVLLACVAGWLVMQGGKKSPVVGEATSAQAQVSVLTPQPPASATREKPFINSLGMKFVPVPGTNVLFCIHETRHKDFAVYASENPNADDTWRDQTLSDYPITERSDEHPAINLTWNDAKAFCDWLSRKENRAYRLPTDREWSMAIGIGHTETWNSETTPSTVFKDKKLYLWGDQYPPPPGSGNFSDQSRKAKAPSKEAKIGYIDGYDDGFPTTAPVMSFKPNSFGLYDLGGNVVEWCEDWFDNLRKHRVQRGLGCGHWWEGHIPELFLASTRTAYPAGSRKGTFGFRCVVEVQHTSQPSAVGLNPAPVIQSKPASPELAPISKSTASVPNASLVPKQPPEFLALEQQYRAALEKQVVPAVTEYAKTLLASYRNALDRAARTLGISSTDATALRAETQRLATDPTVPDADPPGTPQSLTTLRNTFRQAVATFRAEKEAPLKAIYDKQVAELLAQRAKNPHLATKDSPFINGLKMTFVPVPGTKVLMCIHETRNKDYGRFADSNKDTNNKWRNPMTWDAVSISEGAENPVLNVSFEDAMAFCRWLRDQEGITYRLPSDREWSQAVGIAEGEVDNVHPSELNKTAKSHWPWGTTWPPPEGAGNIPDGTYAKRYPTAFFIKEYEDGYITTAPVMSFKPNSFGIYDLAGNAEEICDTWLTAENQRKVVRGGGWHLPMRRAIKNDLRSGWRTGIAPGERSNSTGFRCVVDLAASGAAPSSAQAASKSNPPSTSATAPTPAPVSPTTPTMVRRGGVDRFDSARFSSGLVMFETNLESQIMPAASSSYTPLLLQDLYTACVELEIEQCQKTAARAADLSWFEAERERVRSKSYPNGSNDPAQPDRLQKMRAAYWQAAVEIDRRLDAQKK